MKWSVAEARARFSDLLRKASNEPQEIYNHDRLVAAVIGPESFQELAESNEKAKRRTLRESFAEMRAIMAEEGYRLEIPSRKDRKNVFPKVLDGLPR